MSAKLITQISTSASNSPFFQTQFQKSCKRTPLNLPALISHPSRGKIREGYGSIYEKLSHVNFKVRESFSSRGAARSRLRMGLTNLFFWAERRKRRQLSITGLYSRSKSEKASNLKAGEYASAGRWPGDNLASAGITERD